MHLLLLTSPKQTYNQQAPSRSATPSQPMLSTPRASSPPPPVMQLRQVCVYLNSFVYVGSHPSVCLCAFWFVCVPVSVRTRRADVPKKAVRLIYQHFCRVFVTRACTWVCCGMQASNYSVRLHLRAHGRKLLLIWQRSKRKCTVTHKVVCADSCTVSCRCHFLCNYY